MGNTYTVELNEEKYEGNTVEELLDSVIEIDRKHYAQQPVLYNRVVSTKRNKMIERGTEIADFQKEKNGKDNQTIAKILVEYFRSTIAREIYEEGKKSKFGTSGQLMFGNPTPLNPSSSFGKKNKKTKNGNKRRGRA